MLGKGFSHLKARWLFGDGVLQDAQQHPQPPPQDAIAPLCQSASKCCQCHQVSLGNKATLKPRPSITGNIANLRPWFPNRSRDTPRKAVESQGESFVA